MAMFFGLVVVDVFHCNSSCLLVCRSEMHVKTISVRFGLMLEAYCRGAGQYMKELSEQLTALNKMKHATDKLQTMKKSKTEDFLKCLYEKQFTSAMDNLTSPLDPSLHCKRLK